MKTMRERFDEYFKYMSGGYYASKMGRHAVHPDDIEHFIEQELKKEREEIVEMIKSKIRDGSLEIKINTSVGMFAADIINTIKNRT